MVSGLGYFRNSCSFAFGAPNNEDEVGLLDDPEDNEVDLASLAYQIWKNACDADPALRKSIPDLPDVIFSTKALSAVAPGRPGGQGVEADSGVMVYVRTADGDDALADEVRFAHIAPGRKSDRLARRLTEWQIPFSAPNSLVRLEDYVDIATWL